VPGGLVADQQHAHRLVPVRAQRAEQPLRLSRRQDLGSVRGTRTSGTVRHVRDPPRRRLDRQRGTG
jgi:hypothetical protein